MGGAQKVLYEFLLHTHPQKINARVVIFGGPGKVKDLLENLGVETLCVKHINFFLKTTWLLLPLIPFVYLWRLFKIVKFSLSQKPDIIHAWSVPACDVAVLLSLIIRRPVAATLHIGINNPKVPWIRKISLKWAAEYVRTFVCVSEAVKKDAMAVGIPAEKCKVIYNGISDKNVIRKKVKAVNEKMRSGEPVAFANIGVINRQKGQLVFLRAIGELLKKDCRNWYSIVAGDTVRGVDNSYKKELIRFTETVGLGGKVDFRGWVDNVDGFLNKIDVLVFTSVEFDSLPTIIIETTQKKIPVIASDVGGVSEIIISGDNGWLYPAGNYTELAQIMEDILKGKKQLTHAALFQFTIDRYVQNMFDMYKQLNGQR